MKELLSSEQIRVRITEMGREIRAAVGDEPIVVVAVLKGSFMFLADLVRAIDGEVRVEFLGVSSYRGTTSSGVVQITHDLSSPIEGCHCLVVEDIVDTGLTLSYLLKTLGVRKPASLLVTTLLDKPSRRKVNVEADFVGFTIEDHFVVGFGLDMDQRFRNLPNVMIYEGE